MGPDSSGWNKGRREGVRRDGIRGEWEWEVGEGCWPGMLPSPPPPPPLRTPVAVMTAVSFPASASSASWRRRRASQSSWTARCLQTQHDPHASTQLNSLLNHRWTHWWTHWQTGISEVKTNASHAHWYFCIVSLVLVFSLVSLYRPVNADHNPSVWRTERPLPLVKTPTPTSPPTPCPPPTPHPPTHRPPSAPAAWPCRQTPRRPPPLPPRRASRPPAPAATWTRKRAGRTAAAESSPAARRQSYTPSPPPRSPPPHPPATPPPACNNRVGGQGSGYGLHSAHTPRNMPRTCHNFISLRLPSFN